jgi:hypothetical protein
MDSPNSRRPKKSRQVKIKVKSKLIILLDIKRLFTEPSSWQAKQSIPHTTLTFYGDCLKMFEDFAPNFGVKEIALQSQQRTVSLHSSAGNFGPKAI